MLFCHRPLRQLESSPPCFGSLLILPEPGAANFIIKSLKVWPRTHDGNMMFAKAHSLEESWEMKLGPLSWGKLGDETWPLHNNLPVGITKASGGTFNHWVYVIKIVVEYIYCLAMDILLIAKLQTSSIIWLLTRNVIVINGLLLIFVNVILVGAPMTFRIAFQSSLNTSTPPSTASTTLASTS